MKHLHEVFEKLHFSTKQGSDTVLHSEWLGMRAAMVVSEGCYVVVLLKWSSHFAQSKWLASTFSQFLHKVNERRRTCDETKRTDDTSTCKSEGKLKLIEQTCCNGATIATWNCLCLHTPLSISQMTTLLYSHSVCDALLRLF